MNKIYQDTFETNLGKIAFTLFSSCDCWELKEKKNHKIIESNGHVIGIHTLELQQKWLHEEINFEKSKGWICKIEKKNSLKETIYVEVVLLNPSTGTRWSEDIDEYVDAIEIEDHTNHLHIGTESGLALLSRAKEDDYLPKRFISQLGWDGEDIRSFTDFVEYGLRTEVPELVAGEKIYFHYLVATNTIKDSKEYPGDRDISTWWAVSFSKKVLEEYIKQNNDS